MLSVMVTRSVGTRPSPATLRRVLPWALREAGAGIAAGAAGTAVMTTTAWLHRVIHQRRRGAPSTGSASPSVILDYDDSDHVVIAASTVLRAVIGWAPQTPRGRRALFLLVHWGYGSAVGIGHRALRAGLGGEPAAGAAFFVGCETMALSLFPVLGDTPPPWRWRRDLLVTSFVQHAVYAGTVAATTAMLPPPTAPPARAR